MFKNGDLVREKKGIIMVTDGLPFEYNSNNLSKKPLHSIKDYVYYYQDNYTIIPLKSIELVQYTSSKFKINVKEKEDRIVYTEEQVLDILFKFDTRNLADKYIKDLQKEYKEDIKEWWDENKDK